MIQGGNKSNIAALGLRSESKFCDAMGCRNMSKAKRVIWAEVLFLLEDKNLKSGLAVESESNMSQVYRYIYYLSQAQHV